MKVLFIPRLSDSVLDMARALKPEGIELEIIKADATEDDLVRALGSVEAVMGMILKPLPPAVWAAMKNLKLVQVLSAGYDEVDLAALRAMRVPLANNGGANAVAVAEHTIMLMLAVYRHLVTLAAKCREGDWYKGPPGSIRYHELEGKTVGLVGFGMIGRQVAKRLRAFDTNIVYYDVFRASPAVEAEYGVTFLPLDELLRTVDVLSLHVPLSPETEKMIGREQLALMKPSAIFINTARGGLVDQEALYEALTAGKIAAAGLDTVEPEPPPADLPLLRLPNVTCTPHVAGPTVESWPKRLRNAYANLLRVSRGEKPQWIVPEMRDLFQ